MLDRRDGIKGGAVRLLNVAQNVMLHGNTSWGMTVCLRFM
jgi:hypothetical protein